ncbi:MAG: gliding motility-associated ABC transporter ATP-binding subunit GldA [Flavobacteriales bacterium]
MSITATNIVKTYGTQHALNDVSFTIPTGEVVGFLGPNGAGKSTMMKIITCYMQATKGKVEVCGLDVNDKALDVKRLVGYLPEHNPLYPDMYVREYLRFVGGMYGISGVKDRADAMIERVGLTRESHKRIGQLSKGYRQRVGLAAAMIHDPQVLILDEPTSGLDPNQLVDIRALIRSLGAEKTVMLSTHIMQEVEAICNRVLIIDQGNIVADNDVQSLRGAANQSGYLLDLEVDGDLPPDVLYAIDGVVNVEDRGTLRWRLTVGVSADIRREVSQQVVEAGAAVLGLTRVEQSLEDVFKQLTGNQPD